MGSSASVQAHGTPTEPPHTEQECVQDLDLKVNGVTYLPAVMDALRYLFMLWRPSLGDNTHRTLAWISRIDYLSHLL